VRRWSLACGVKKLGSGLQVDLPRPRRAKSAARIDRPRATKTALNAARKTGTRLSPAGNAGVGSVAYAARRGQSVPFPARRLPDASPRTDLRSGLSRSGGIVRRCFGAGLAGPYRAGNLYRVGQGVDPTPRLKEALERCENAMAALDALRDDRLAGVLHAMSVLHAEIVAALASISDP
jgi:hypothetical protein